MVGPRKLSSAAAIAAVLVVMTQPGAAETSRVDGEVRAALRAAVAAASDPSAGVLFGVLDSLGVEPRVWAEGAVDTGDELRLGCPTGKPILVYLALRERVPLSARIARWFPEGEGFTRSRDIEVQHLMLNSSGIRDYVPMLALHPDSAVTVDATIDRAYRGKALLFDPGSGFEYSNTNFNLLGRLLEIETGMGLDSLVRTSFARSRPRSATTTAAAVIPGAMPGRDRTTGAAPGTVEGLSARLPMQCAPSRGSRPSRSSSE